MTYTAGTRILAQDYNTLGAGVNQTWSTAYGQSAVGTVNTNVKVTATNWGTLVNTLSNQALHQATAITARTAPQTGNLIAIFNSLSTDVTTTYNNRYNAYALGTQYTAWTGTSSKTTNTVLGLDTDPWTISFVQTVQFASASALSRFFNAGGLIKLQFSKTSTGLPNDTYWNAFIATCGDVYLSATGASKIIAGITFSGTTRIGGTGGASVATGIGYEQLTLNPTTIFQKSPTDYLYQNSYVRVQARVTLSNQLILQTDWFQQERNPFATPPRPTSISGGAPAAGVSVGTAPTTICTYFPPESTYLTNTWGTPTVSSLVSGPVLQQYSYTTPGVYNFTVPATLSGSLIVSLMVGAGGGGGGSQFDGDGHGAANGGSGGYYTNTEVAASAGLNLVVAVGAGGAGVPAANSAGGSAGGLSSMSTGGPGFGLVAGGGGGGAGCFGDNGPAFGGSAGSPNGSPGSNSANWMVQRNTQGNGYNGTGQNGTGYGNGGLGGNSNGPVGQGTAGGNGIVNFQLAVTVTT